MSFENFMVGYILLLIISKSSKPVIYLPLSFEHLFRTVFHLLSMYLIYYKNSICQQFSASYGLMWINMGDNKNSGECKPNTKTQ